MKKQEIEIKIRIKNPEKLRNKLKSLGWHKEKELFQKTYRTWHPDKLFARAGIFPRTRMTKETGKERHTFTVKARFKDPEKGLFEREEHEVSVEDSSEVAKMLSLLGFSHQRILEKKRQVWKKNGQEIIELLIDELPFGVYLEIEGTKESIIETLKELGLQNAKRLGMAYWDVYWHYCKENNIKERKNLVFDHN